MSKDQQIKDLEKKITKLEKVISTQKKLIEVLKTLPSNKNVKLKPKKGDPKKNGLPKRTQGQSGSVVDSSSVREPENSSRSVECFFANTQVMEDASSLKV